MGNRYVMQAIAARVAEHVYAEPLTVRERQILEFLADGRCNKTIANELGIAVGTVKTHVKAVLSKLNVSSRTQAVVVATRRGLVRSEEQGSESVAYGSSAHDAGSPYASLRVPRDPTGEVRLPGSAAWVRAVPLLAASSH
jgi:DNA-binding CsgD family transcriptional regulator